MMIENITPSKYNIKNNMGGNTHSSVHNYEFKQTGNFNLYEEVIDKLMVDNYLTSEQGEFIRNLPNNKKRRAIFIMVGRKSQFVMEEVLKIEKETSFINGLDIIIESIDEYIEVGKKEAKTHGEVFTPLNLVDDMLDTLPDDVWSNPNLKWLDPANGMGNFPIKVIKRLMKGLMGWEKDEEKRYKHIIENMIYACELQPRNAFMYLFMVDTFDTNIVNLFCGSFLSDGFDKHMRDVWGVNKFDIVIGNPPYNGPVTKSGNSVDIFDNFILKSIELCEKVLLITPSRWFSKASLKHLKNKLINKLDFIEHFPKSNEVFEDTDITSGVSYFLYNDNKNSKYTKFNNLSINLNEQNDIFGTILYEQTSYEEYKNIINKIKNRNLGNLKNFNSQSYFKVSTNNIQKNGEIKCFYSNQKGKKYNLNVKNKRYYNNVSTFIDKNNKIRKWKVITSSAYGANPNGLGRVSIIEPNEICSESFIFFDFDTKCESMNFKKYLNTKFVKFLISIKKNKQHVTSKVFSLVPELDFTKEWDDKKLADYFSLNSEEIELIDTINN